MTLKKIETIKEVIDSYEYFIIDIWGVLHDGNLKAFPHAIKLLKLLKSKEKISLILSNSPRNVADVKLNLADKGINPDIYTHVHTSGQEVENLLFEKEHKFFRKLGSKVFILGFSNLHEKSGHKVVTKIEAADYILATRVPGENLNDSLATLDKAISKNIPLVCANPDLVAQTFAGPCPCPGIIYDYYKLKGGNAIAIGKPHQEVYTRILSLLKEKHSSFDKTKTVIIGDGMFTDILGANRQGLDSVLISSGIHGDLFDLGNLGNEISDQDFYEISKQIDSLPNYICEKFH